MTVKILFLKQLRKQVMDYIKSGISELDTEISINNKREDLIQANILSEADIIIGWRIPLKLLKKAKNLKLFINPGAGVQQHIQNFQKINKTRKIILVNGHGNSYLTAQQGVALLLSLTNRIINHHLWMCAGKWRTGDREAPSIPLRNRRIGLLGYGAVNSKVHKFLSGFNNRFAVLRCNHRNTEKYPTPIQKFTLQNKDSFFKNIDTLIAAIPLKENTKNFITEKELKLLGKKGLLVNIARGEIINQKDLYHALKNQQIKAAAIDV